MVVIFIRQTIKQTIDNFQINCLQTLEGFTNN
nr:MAG TPA: hypothetical protein [Caudoviricetes sp.]DAW91600.1 MAG TPA: hypothetical protein [Bacteriophage sp.]